MPKIFHLIIKKAYAASIIEHLKLEGAIEIIDEEVVDIPEWQKAAVRETLVAVQEQPELLQPWNIVKQKYKRP